MRCSFDDDTYLTYCKNTAWHIDNGLAEPYTGNKEFIKDYVKKTGRNKTYIDVGTHIGTHSVVFSRIFQNVISFEPDKINFETLNTNILLNSRKNITSYNKALSNISEYVHSVAHSDHSRGCMFIQKGGDIEAILLDSLKLENIDYIKIDVEGNELSVLLGALDTIKRNLPLIEFEHNGLSDKLFNVSFNDIEIFLTGLGYKCINKIDNNYFFEYK